MGEAHRGQREVFGRDVGWRALVSSLWDGRFPRWQDEAACRGRDPRWWHGGRGSARARAICLRCPVRRECLADAVAWETQTATRAANPWGVVGGLTATQRRALYEAFPSAVGEPGFRRRSPRR